MAEAEVANDFGFLTKKVGPLPVWIWALLIAGGYYLYTHKGSGASGQVTQVEEDQITTEPQFGGSHYKTNAEWADAAVNYLVGESVPPDEASVAIWNYLHSKALTGQEQKDVNLAIQGIGPPPNIPAPATVPTPTPHKHKHPSRVPNSTGYHQRGRVPTPSRKTRGKRKVNR